VVAPPAHDHSALGYRFPRLIGRVAWLGRHRSGVMVLVVVAVAGALALDVAFPSYPIAGFYLVPVTLAALTLRVRVTIFVSVVCLVLALYVMTIQGRTDGPTITVVCFSVLSGAGLIALSYLFKQVGQLYETERLTTARLESLATQLQTLQEVVVLDTDRPLSDLFRGVLEQATQLLGSDGCCVYRLDPPLERLRVVASSGVAPPVGGAVESENGRDPISRALACGVPVAEAGGKSGRSDAGERDERSESTYGALLAVPLLARDDSYGVLALFYEERRSFTDVDTRLAASFGGQVALAIENARLRDRVEQDAAASERSRLARELHDSVTQSLFAASLKAEAVLLRWRPRSAEARRNVEEVERLTRGALAEMRTLLIEMRPEALDEASLGTLLGHLVAVAEGRMLVDVELSVTGDRQLPSAVTVALYRVAQEALHNIEHHSRAGAAWVTLDLGSPVVRLVVADDGRGFDPVRVSSERFGLRIMHERAKSTGVHLSIESAEGRGTVVTAEWQDPGED
jgi:signal transduction histidine kinase